MEGRLVGGRYRLSGELGRGGMGVVWRAHDELLDRPVALKEVILPPWVTPVDRDQTFTRVLREARAAARLRHPSVVTIYDVVIEEGHPWIAMELLPAVSLEDRIRSSGPLPEPEAAEMGLQILDALRVAHRAGIMHRDIKPANVMLLDDGGGAVLTDFGIAQIQGDATLTASGMLVGSPGFMAPERIEGNKAGPAADLWALGATLYTAVEGRAPFHRSEQMAVLAAVLTRPPEPMRLAALLRPVIDGLLIKDPAERLSHEAVLAELTQARTGTPPPKHIPTLIAPDDHRSTDNARPLPVTLDDHRSADEGRLPRPVTLDERRSDEGGLPPAVSDERRSTDEGRPSLPVTLHEGRSLDEGRRSPAESDTRRSTDEGQLPQRILPDEDRSSEGRPPTRVAPDAGRDSLAAVVDGDRGQRPAVPDGGRGTSSGATGGGLRAGEGSAGTRGWAVAREVTMGERVVAGLLAFTAGLALVIAAGEVVVATALQTDLLLWANQRPDLAWWYHSVLLAFLVALFFVTFLLNEILDPVIERLEWVYAVSAAVAIAAAMAFWPIDMAFPGAWQFSYGAACVWFVLVALSTWQHSRVAALTLAVAGLGLADIALTGSKPVLRAITWVLYTCWAALGVVRLRRSRRPHDEP